MKHIRTKFIISMTTLAFVILAFTGSMLMINISTSYRREFYESVKPIVTSNEVLECATTEQLATTLENALGERVNFYILKDGAVVFASVDGGQLKTTDNLEKVISGKSCAESDMLWDTLDYGVCAKGGLSVYVKDTMSALFEQIKEISLHLASALVIGFLLSVIISFLLSKRLTHSIGILKKGAERMAGGDFTPIEITQNDEIGSLATVLNSMGAQIVKDYDEFERQEKVRRDFVANVSHELKTPLTVIKSYSDTLVGMELDDATRSQFLSTIGSEVDRMSDIVSKLLEISQIEAKAQTTKAQIDLSKTVADLMQSFLLQIEQKAITLTTNGRATVTANADSVGAIITNLIENAVKYTNDGGYIDIELKDNAISIKNSGAGIAPRDLEHIFERFYRADKARSRDTGGTGLGLAIAKECADAIGATISAKSVEGEYTKFTVNFNAN